MLIMDWNDGSWTETLDAPTDVIRKPVPGVPVNDMRGEKVRITKRYVEGNFTIEEGDAYIFNGNTGPLSPGKIPLIFGEGNISTFYAVDAHLVDLGKTHYAGRTGTPAHLPPTHLGHAGNAETNFYF
jgi:hypothetical protein